MSVLLYIIPKEMVFICVHHFSFLLSICPSVCPTVCNIWFNACELNLLSEWCIASCRVMFLYLSVTRILQLSGIPFCLVNTRLLAILFFSAGGNRKMWLLVFGNGVSLLRLNYRTFIILLITWLIFISFIHINCLALGDNVKLCCFFSLLLFILRC